MSSASDELVLLERVFLRFGTAETDEQLENVLAKFLPPVLLKLSSPQDGVRKKVMELLVHISKRVKSRPQVQLPVDALLMQYQDPSATAFVINFTIIYIKLGFPRLDENKQAELLPCLLNCLDGRPQLHQDSLLLLMMSVLPHLKIPQDPQKAKCLLGLNEKPAIAQLVSEFALDMILLPYGMAKVDTSLKRPSSQDGSNATPPPPPGMSEAAFKRVMGEQPMSPDQLEKVKLALVKFLSCGVYPEIEILPHLIVASSDTRHSVASAADYEMKKISGSIDWNNSQMIGKLFNLFLGGTNVKEQQKQNVRPEHKRTPTNTRIRLKIFPCLLKSSEAATRFPFVLQVIFESLYGQTTNGKLRIMAVQFVDSVCNNCSQKILLPFGNVLLSGLTKLIPESREEPRLQNMTYVAIGRICQKLPQLLAKDLSVLQNLFDALGKENQDTRMAIQESLSLMAKSVSALDDNVKGLIEALIKANIESPESQVRQMALHYAVTVFPSDHIPSRYVVMIAAGDVKDEIRSDALKALHITQGSRHLLDEDPSKNKFPPFPALINYLFNEAEYRKKSSFKYVSGNNVLPFNPATYFEMIRYVRRCLAASAEVSSELLIAESLQEQAPTIAVYVRNLLNAKSNGNSPVIIYTSMIRQLLTTYVEPSLVYYLLEVTAIVPDLVAKQLLEDLQLIKNLMSSSREEVRENAAQLLAVLLVSAFDDRSVDENIAELIKISKDKNLETQHGAVLTLGYVIGRKLYNLKKSNLSDSSESNPRLRESVLLIASFLNNPQMHLQVAACVALGEISRNGSLPLPENTSEETSDVSFSKEKIISMLADIIKSSKASQKAREKAAQALGYLCVGDARFKYAQKVIGQLLEAMFEITDVDLHFTLGEAVCNAALGPGSFAAQDPWTESKSDVHVSRHGGRESEVEWLLSEILGRYIIHTKSSVRQAAAICILSLLKLCGHLQSVMDKMSHIQNALVNLLADSNDLTQDVASKGLSLLYEKGTEEEKKQLLGILVDTLTTGRRQNINVTDDTKVFQEGELGPLPEGGNLTTYKELCALATDLNQPDLVYKFMNLANYNATWNSKKGAAFGFGSIAQQAGEQLEVLLPSIVPRLYRYQYDPIPSIRASFITIWRAIVRDPAKTVDKYVKEILMDLMENLTNPQWRVRESSCLGLCDLLQGRQITDILEFLPELWRLCFRVADDIKETVRNAAESALKVLSKVSVKNCDSSSGKAGQQALTLILPTLIKHGLSNPVAKVKQLSLSTIVQISKSAGPLLKPHIPLLMVSLLEALSGMESQTLNYLSVRLEPDSAVQEKLDSARIAVMKSSPMMETVNHCVQYVDEEVLVELVPRLVDLIRSSVGLGTKTGCANLVISLTYQCPAAVQPHAGKLLSALMNGLGDRNANIRKSYASAIGYLAKVAKDSSVERLISKISAWYMEKEEDSVRASCAHILQTLARHGPDVLRDHAAQVLPLAFFAMHCKSDKGDSSTSTQSHWEDIWMEFTPGTEGGVRLYLDEILVLVRKGTESQSWAQKQQSAMVVTALATKAGSCIDSSRVVLLLDLLLTGLAGRTWTGKETLLEAVSSICVCCKSALLKANDENPEQEIIKQVVQTVLRECKKENWVYKSEAIKCLGKILYELGEDRFSDLFELLHPLLIRDRSGNSESDDDGERDGSRRDAQCNFQSVAYESLGQAWPSTVETQDKYLQQFSELLTTRYSLSTWKVQLSIMRALKHLISRLKCIEVFVNNKEQQELVSTVINRIATTIVQALGVSKYNSVRDEGFAVLNTLLERLKVSGNKHLMQEVATSQLRGVLTSLQNDSNHQIQDKAKQYLKAVIDIDS